MRRVALGISQSRTVDFSHKLLEIISATSNKRSARAIAALAGILVEKSTVRDWLIPEQPAAFFGKRS